MSDPLKKVKRAAAKAARSREELDSAMREAHGEGHTLRNIAAAANVSHTQVLRIVSSGTTAAAYLAAPDWSTISQDQA